MNYGELITKIYHLSESESIELYEMIYNHAKLLNKLIPGVILLEYAATGIDSDPEAPGVAGYKMWKQYNSKV